MFLWRTFLGANEGGPPFPTVWMGLPPWAHGRVTVPAAGNMPPLGSAEPHSSFSEMPAPTPVCRPCLCSGTFLDDDLVVSL